MQKKWKCPLKKNIVSFLFVIMSVTGAWADGANDDAAPGISLAQKTGMLDKVWNTTDHSKHAALNGSFAAGPEITKACLSCHNEAEAQIHKSIHWTWAGENPPGEYGKARYSVNNFCISANKMGDKGCLSCHPGWNGQEDGVNCLVCHGKKKLNWNEAFDDLNYFGGEDDPESQEMAADIRKDIQLAVTDIGRPTRENCGDCHFKGGGGDGVKHGDLDTSLTKPRKSLDVHMGVDGQNFDCVRCHTTRSHNIAGRVYTAPAATDRKSLIEDDLSTKITCESCHSATPHKTTSKANDHTDRVACQSCHIPKFARVNPTKMSWDWSQAGRRKDGKPYKTVGPYGKHDYLSIKGQMKWEKNVVPEYFWYNGSIASTTTKDVIDPSKPVAVSYPVGSPEDKNSRIYPFKVHQGKQPYDKVNNTLLAPKVSGKDGFFTTMNMPESLEIGMKMMDLPYSGQYDYVETTYVYPTTHMVAPKENVVACTECHQSQNSRLTNLAGIYMPGRDHWKILDTLGWLTVLGSLGAVTLHGVGRFFTNGRRKPRK